MVEWLEQHRLTRHEARITTIAGPDCGLDDLPLLSDADVATLVSTMTNVEASRFVAARKLITTSESAVDSQEAGDDERM